MESFWILGSIAFALMLGAMSPGPTSIYVAKIQLPFHVNMVYLLHWVLVSVQRFWSAGGSRFAGILLAVPSAYLALKFVVVYICFGWRLKSLNMPKIRSKRIQPLANRCLYAVLLLPV